MGMRRLSIIDLSGGHQPMFNEDGTIAVVQNGEIYNFQELRRTSKPRGHRLRTSSDTEAIVHLYEELRHARCREAPARHVRVRGLGCAPAPTAGRPRSASGIKPLYCGRRRRHACLFGSELKSLLAAGIDREIDRQALHDYLSLDATSRRAGDDLPLGAEARAGNACSSPRTAAVRIERYW